MAATNPTTARPENTPTGPGPTVVARPAPETEQIVTFLRKRDYQLVRELGQGACGQTVLLRDPYLDEQYVCKKYLPYAESERQSLFEHFVKEVKLLHLLYHRNVVRVFNHFLYPAAHTGYILMELVDGVPIDRHLERHPDQINSLFIQAVAGFSYLEQTGVLHRDIRPDNLMVTDGGTLKIIDLGFGKRVRVPQDFAKSINLNWAYQPPEEFAQSKYDFATELYFVGVLFQSIIESNCLVHFKHKDVLRKMCERIPSNRFSGFQDLDREIGTNRFEEIDFHPWELQSYRQFANAIEAAVTKIEARAKYADDPDKLVDLLGVAFRAFMLEDTVPDNQVILRHLIIGTYHYKRSGISVEIVRDFLDLMRKCGPEKRRIILANLRTRLDALPHFVQPPPPIDPNDIPF